MKFLRDVMRVPETQSLSFNLGQPQGARNYPAAAMGLKGSLVLFFDAFCPSQIMISVFVWHLCNGCPVRLLFCHFCKMGI